MKLQIKKQNIFRTEAKMRKNCFKILEKKKSL